MNAEHSIPPLRDLPLGRLAERKRHLLSAIEGNATPRLRWRGVKVPRFSVIALAIPALALVSAVVVLSLGTRSASGTPALPAPLPFAHGSNQPAVTLLEQASVRQHDARVAADPATYAKTQNYALQTNISGTTADTYVETTIRQVWIAENGSALAKSWSQDTTRAGVPVGQSTFAGTDASWQDTNTGLPSTPAALRAALLSGLSPNSPDEQNLILAQEIMSHLGEGTASSAQVAALYQLLARLPGVFDAGQITDNAGRHGVAVGIPTGTFDAGPTCLDTRAGLSPSQIDAKLAQHGALGQSTTYLVIDPATGKPLQVESVDTPNAPCALGLPREPMIEQYNVLLTSGQVASVGAVNP